MSDQDQATTASSGQGGGSGKLAQFIATRGGLAAAEAPFVIEHREALIYMLCEAAELEHGIMCQYLFAAFSLKQGPGEGLTEAEAITVRRWRMQISRVATQEMLHLALVHNVLSAVGAAPHLARPNFPAPANHYPAGVQLALLPFGEEALRHFMFLERPEGMDLADADGLAAVGRAAPVLNERDIVPRGQDFATVGHLYRSIEAGLAHLVELHGEDWLFVGPARAQATAAHFGWPELVPVTDLASAQSALDEILEQGEGPRGHWRDAHFGQFVAILDEYQQMRAANPGFDPVRPVLAANVRPAERDAGVPLISDPLTARVVDLFNVGYEILLQIFERFFAHTDETDAQLKVLADATIALMLQVIKPLGDMITTLPVGGDRPGATAGPSFELFYETDYLMPHKHAAWALLAERLDEGAWLCDQLRTGRGQRVAGALEPVLSAMREISATLAEYLPAGSAHGKLATAPSGLGAADLDALVRRAGELGAARAGSGPQDVAALFDAAHQLVSSAAAGAGCAAGEQALIVPRLVESVMRPLADELVPGARVTAGKAAPDEVARSRTAAEQVKELAVAATALRARMADECPPGLAEATAALQSLALGLLAGAEADRLRAEFWRLQDGLAASIRAARNGPYLATNVPSVTDHLGIELDLPPQLALCRCGNSAIKPLCDGSHARTGFRDAKDRARVPDRRDTYPGQQLTIFDNRGICQHSGLCTDRLATVFRTGAEPFVAPSGGRMDEIIRAVRDCPSGALSYAIDGTEARTQVDWANSRPPSIEITRNGPYRITGHIDLVGADGSRERRAAGSSREHYALCRCGHSQNKPFCSGMHWYVEFRDPKAGPEPTLFEAAGGLPGLARFARLLYEKHIPADPLLAPLFAGMEADQPLLLARWLASALGAPRRRDGPGGPGPGPAVGFPGPAREDERARWVRLAATAADESGLPSGPAFRSAFASCVEWLSRVAAAGPAGPQAAMRVPRWEWGPGGPDPAESAGGDTGQAEPGQADDAAVVLPGSGQAVGFAAHIRPLFRERDRRSMSFAFDLWSAEDVRGRAPEILRRLKDGSMPCDGAWPAERIEVFNRWIEDGMRD